MRYLISTYVLTLALMASASAQELDIDDMNAIIRSLAPKAGQSIATEGLPPRLDLGRSPDAGLRIREITVDTTVIRIDRSRSIDIEVFFPFGSAELTVEARNSLLELGAALASRALRDHAYLVAGHTDARGSAEYNLRLSSARAQAVRTFLLERFALSPERLVAVGFGEEDLKVPQNPNAGINRRVEISLIVGR